MCRWRPRPGPGERRGESALRWRPAHAGRRDELGPARLLPARDRRGSPGPSARLVCPRAVPQQGVSGLPLPRTRRGGGGRPHRGAGGSCHAILPGETLVNRRNAGTARLRRVALDGLSAMKLRLILAGLGLLGVTLTELAAPWPLKIIFDHILLQRPLPSALAPLEGLMYGRPTLALVLLSCSIAAIALANGSFSYLQIHTTSAIGHQLVYRLRRELFTKVSSDTGILRDALGDWALTFGAHVLTLSGMLVIMFMLSWSLSLVILLTLPLLFVVLMYLNRRLRLTARTQRHQEGRLASRLNEVLG